MAANFPYMQSSKNLRSILEKVQAAGTPPKFTQDFLKNNLGFGSSSDRSVIGVLKGLGFLTPDGIPTARYNEFRNATLAGGTLATGLRDGWAEIFLSDQNANELTPAALKELFKNVSGKGESAAEKMATTFRVLAEMADFAATPAAPVVPEAEAETTIESAPVNRQAGSAVALHHDVHIHLPETSDATVYTAIFRALREELLD